MTSVIIEKLSVGDPANILKGSKFGLGSGKASLRKQHVSWSLWDKQRSPNVSDPLPHNGRCSQPHPDLVPVDTEVASSRQTLTNFTQSQPQAASPQPCMSLSSHTEASLLFLELTGSLHMGNLKCGGLNSTYCKIWPAKKERLWIKPSWEELASQTSVQHDWAVSLNKDSISHLCGLLPFFLCFTLPAPHPCSLRLDSPVKVTH